MGINGPWSDDRARHAPFIKQCRDLGVGMARVTGDWTFIQRDQRAGVYNVDQFEPLYKGLNDAGIVVQAVCGYTPNYLHPKRPTSPHTIPDEDKWDLALHEYEEAMYRLGKRYPYLHIIELFSNEASCPYGMNPVRADITYLLASAGAKGFRRAKHEQGQPCIVMMNSTAACATEYVDAAKTIKKEGGGRWVWDFVDEMYMMHHFFCAISGKNHLTTPTPWDVLNSHTYMTWGGIFKPGGATTGPALDNYGPGNSLTYATNVLIWAQAMRRNQGRTDIRQPYVWNSEAGWPITFGHGVDGDVRYMAKRGGWNGSSTPTKAQIEQGAYVVAKEHLSWWFEQQDKNFVGPFNIFYCDAAPDGTGWTYGLYDDLMVANTHQRKTVQAIKEMAALPFIPPKGWMQGLGLVPAAA